MVINILSILGVLKIFLGDLDVQTLVAGLLWAGAGLTASILLDAMMRDPMKDGSPTKFSWKHLITDNTIRFLRQATLDVIFIVATLRFMNDLIGTFSMFYCFLVGLAIDMVIDNWKAIRAKFGGVFKQLPQAPPPDNKPQ